MNTCQNHPEKQVSWVCLEKMCDIRVMCNICAVKLHDKNHKVEELEKVQRQDNFQQSINDQLKEWQFMVKNDEMKSVNEEMNYMLNDVQDKLKTILDNFHNLQQTFQTVEEDEFQKMKFEKVKKNIIKTKIKQENALQKLLIIQNNIQSSNETSSEELSSQLQEGINLVYDKLMKKSSNPQLFNVIRKRELLNQIKQYYLQLSKFYFNNLFTSEFCNLFDIQIDTISKEQNPNIMNETRFIEFVNKKWKNDFNVLESAINMSVQKLNKVLKYTLNENNQSQMLQNQQYLNYNMSPQNHFQNYIPNMFIPQQPQFQPMYYQQQFQVQEMNFIEGSQILDNIPGSRQPRILIQQQQYPMEFDPHRQNQSPIRYIQKG